MNELRGELSTDSGNGLNGFGERSPNGIRRLKLRRPLKAKTLRVLETLRVLMCGHPTAVSIMSFSILHLSLLPFRPAHVIISTSLYAVKYNSE
jgi:hypothetical protein